MRKTMLLGLMITFLLSLTACSPKYIYKDRVVLVTPEDSLLLSPCQAKEAGETVRTLAKGYVHNTKCIEKYEVTLQAIRDWKVKQESLNKTKEEN